MIERDTSGERLRQLMLGPKGPNEKERSCKGLETAFGSHRFTNDEDVVKVALALFIKMVMMGKDKKTQFDVNTLEIVDDPEVFLHYDWSSVFFRRVVNSMKTILRGKKEAHDIKKA